MGRSKEKEEEKEEEEEEDEEEEDIGVEHVYAELKIIQKRMESMELALKQILHRLDIRETVSDSGQIDLQKNAEIKSTDSRETMLRNERRAGVDTAAEDPGQAGGNNDGKTVEDDDEGEEPLFGTVFNTTSEHRENDASTTSLENIHGVMGSIPRPPAVIRNTLPYQYTPLDASKSQIRILTLQPKSYFGAPITASLSIVSLDNALMSPNIYGFTALSYCWGAPVFDGEIKLDGRALPITKNLEMALLCMRSSSSEFPGAVCGTGSIGRYGTFGSGSEIETHWWIDQICINQKDVDERTEQVNLMRRIYKRASSVAVWLGEEQYDSALAIDVLRTLGQPPVHAPGEKAIRYPALGEDEVQRRWKALGKLFARPWWERVWIRQEVALSGSVKIYVSDESFDMDILGNALVALAYVESLGYQASPGEEEGQSEGGNEEGGREGDNEEGEGERRITLPWTHHAKMLTRLRYNTHGGASWVKLENLLPNGRYCKATDARDTVFSVLGLCDPELYEVTANYRQELPSVLLEAMKAAIDKERALDILGACQNPERENGLPSWVPNLCEPWKAMPFSTRRGGDETSRNLELRVTDNDESKIRIEGETLLIKGGVIDSIALICDTVVKDGAVAADLDKVYDSWRKWVNIAAREKKLDASDRMVYSTYRSGEPELERYKSWARFLSVLKDEANDIDQAPWGHAARRGKGKKKRKKEMANSNDGSDDEEAAEDQGQVEQGTMDVRGILRKAEEELSNTSSYHGLNLKLSRAHLLPSTFTPSLHPNRRIHAGLRANGPGRRLAITKRGLIALVPGEVQIGDDVAVFVGASFSYILRKATGEGAGQSYALVGEAFVPRHTWGQGDRLAREEYGLKMNGFIRLV